MENGNLLFISFHMAQVCVGCRDDCEWTLLNYFPADWQPVDS